MRIKITGRNIELTEGLKAAVEDKLNKLEKYFTPDTDVYVTLSVEKERQKVEVTIPMKGNYVRSEQVSNDMYVSIDLVEEVIERQLKKYRTKLVTKQQNASSVFKKEFLEAKTAKGADGELTDEAATKILAKMVKQRKESAAIYAAQNRDDLAQGELAEVAECIPHY